MRGFKVRPLHLNPNLRERRDYIFLEITRSLCSTCLGVIDARIIARNGRLYLSKRCPEHGEEETLLQHSAEWYSASARCARPAERPVQCATGTDRGCPYDCGTCPSHEQHMCLGIVDITARCNLHCPVCYAGEDGGRDLTGEEIRSAVDGYLRQEGPGGVLQFSGGEPTLHPGLVEAVRYAVGAAVDVIMLNTNGVRLADDDELVSRLEEAGAGKLEIYLQFDGFTDGVTRALRGADLVSVKMRAIDRLLRHRLPVNLVCTVSRGVNEGEIGQIVEFGARTDGIRGVNLQAEIFTGRHRGPPPAERVTLSEILERIETQTRGMLRQSDFLPLPCPHPSQMALTYAYVNHGRVKPIPRFVDLEPYLDQLSNTVFTDPRPIYGKAFEGLWSASTCFSSAHTFFDFACVCGLPARRDFFTTEGRRRFADEHAFRVMVLQFQDRFNWDMKVARKCCVGFALPDGRVVPFDTYNILYRDGHGRAFPKEMRACAPITAETGGLPASQG